MIEIELRHPVQVTAIELENHRTVFIQFGHVKIKPDKLTHRYWRLLISANEIGNISGLAALEMAATPAGSDQCTGGTALTSSYRVGNEPALAFDGDDNTKWISENVSLPSYIGYDFGAEVAVKEVRITI